MYTALSIPEVAKATPIRSNMYHKTGAETMSDSPYLLCVLVQHETGMWSSSTGLFMFFWQHILDFAVLHLLETVKKAQPDRR